MYANYAACDLRLNAGPSEKLWKTEDSSGKAKPTTVPKTTLQRIIY